jgi:hypothetical protein
VLTHPFPSKSEPEKAVCYLTDYDDYEEDHLAWLYNKASLRAIDAFFMQVRQRPSLLERPITTASNNRRLWHGYSAYNPRSIVKLLEMFRVFYNYVLVGTDKQGLAKGRVSLEDIVYFQPWCIRLFPRRAPPRSRNEKSRPARVQQQRTALLLIAPITRCEQSA